MERLNTYSSINKKYNARGTFDYRVIFFLLIYICLMYQILDMFNISIMYIIYILALSLIPLLGIYFTVSKEDDIVDIIINIFKYLLRPKVYIYKYDKKTKKNKKYKFKS